MKTSCVWSGDAQAEVTIKEFYIRHQSLCEEIASRSRSAQLHWQALNRNDLVVIGSCRNGLCINAEAKCVHRVAWPRKSKKQVATLGGATLVPVHYLIEIFCVFASFLEADLLHLPAGLGCVTRSRSIRCYFCFLLTKTKLKTPLEVRTTWTTREEIA